MLSSLFFYRYSQCELMIFFRCSILICKLLLVTLLTSVFAVAAVDNFAHSNIARGSESMLKMTAPAVDGQLCDESEIIFKTQQRWHEILKAAESDSKAAQKCCSSLTVLTLFPVTATAQLTRIQVASLALISRKQTGKAYSFTELIYRPPIA